MSRTMTRASVRRQQAQDPEQYNLQENPPPKNNQDNSNPENLPQQSIHKGSGLQLIPRQQDMGLIVVQNDGNNQNNEVKRSLSFYQSFYLSRLNVLPKRSGLSVIISPCGNEFLYNPTLDVYKQQKRRKFLQFSHVEQLTFSISAPPGTLHKLKASNETSQTTYDSMGNSFHCEIVLMPPAEDTKPYKIDIDALLSLNWEGRPVELDNENDDEPKKRKPRQRRNSLDLTAHRLQQLRTGVVDNGDNGGGDDQNDSIDDNDNSDDDHCNDDDDDDGGDNNGNFDGDYQRGNDVGGDNDNNTRKIINENDGNDAGLLGKQQNQHISTHKSSIQTTSVLQPQQPQQPQQNNNVQLDLIQQQQRNEVQQIQPVVGMMTRRRKTLLNAENGNIINTINSTTNTTTTPTQTSITSLQKMDIVKNIVDIDGNDQQKLQNNHQVIDNKIAQSHIDTTTSSTSLNSLNNGVGNIGNNIDISELRQPRHCARTKITSTSVSNEDNKNADVGFKSLDNNNTINNVTTAILTTNNNIATSNTPTTPLKNNIEHSQMKQSIQTQTQRLLLSPQRDWARELREKDGRIDQLEMNLSRITLDRNQLNTKMSTLEEENVNLNTNMINVQEKLKSMNDDFDKLKIENTHLIQKMKENEEKNNEKNFNDNDDDINELESLIETMKQACRNKTCRGALLVSKDLAKKDKIIAINNNHINNFTTKVDELTTQLESNRIEFAQMRDKYNNLVDNNIELGNRVVQLEDELAQAENNAKNNDENGINLNVSGEIKQQLNSKDEQIEQLQLQINKLMQSSRDNERLLSAQQAELVVLRPLQQKYDENYEKLQNAEKKITTFEKTMNQYQDDMEAYNGEIVTLQQTIDGMEEEQEGLLIELENRMIKEANELQQELINRNDELENEIIQIKNSSTIEKNELIENVSIYENEVGRLKAVVNGLEDDIDVLKHINVNIKDDVKFITQEWKKIIIQQQNQHKNQQNQHKNQSPTMLNKSSISLIGHIIDYNNHHVNDIDMINDQDDVICVENVNNNNTNTVFNCKNNKIPNNTNNNNHPLDKSIPTLILTNKNRPIQPNQSNLSNHCVRMDMIDVVKGDVENIKCGDIIEQKINNNIHQSLLGTNSSFLITSSNSQYNQLKPYNKTTNSINKIDSNNELDSVIDTVSTTYPHKLTRLPIAPLTYDVIKKSTSLLFQFVNINNRNNGVFTQLNDTITTPNNSINTIGSKIIVSLSIYEVYIGKVRDLLSFVPIDKLNQIIGTDKVQIDTNTQQTDSNNSINRVTLSNNNEYNPEDCCISNNPQYLTQMHALFNQNTSLSSHSLPNHSHNITSQRPPLESIIVEGIRINVDNIDQVMECVESAVQHSKNQQNTTNNTNTTTNNTINTSNNDNTEINTNIGNDNDSNGNEILKNNNNNKFSHILIQLRLSAIPLIDNNQNNKNIGSNLSYRSNLATSKFNKHISTITIGDLSHGYPQNGPIINPHGDEYSQIQHVTSSLSALTGTIEQIVNIDDGLNEKIITVNDNSTNDSNNNDAVDDGDEVLKKCTVQRSNTGTTSNNNNVINYRMSKLTMLLKDSLDRDITNGQVCMIYSLDKNDRRYQWNGDDDSAGAGDKKAHLGVESLENNNQYNNINPVTIHSKQIDKHSSLEAEYKHIFQLIQNIGTVLYPNIIDNDDVVVDDDIQMASSNDNVQNKNKSVVEGDSETKDDVVGAKTVEVIDSKKTLSASTTSKTIQSSTSRAQLTTTSATSQVGKNKQPTSSVGSRSITSTINNTPLPSSTITPSTNARINTSVPSSIGANTIKKKLPGVSNSKPNVPSSSNMGSTSSIGAIPPTNGRRIGDGAVPPRGSTNNGNVDVTKKRTL